MERLLRDKTLKKLYPVGKGKLSKTSCVFTKEGDYFKCVIPSGQLPFITGENNNDESINSLFLVCSSVNPTSYSGNLINYVFKIIDSDNSTGELWLEQTYEDYSYISTWTSNIEIWKAIWLGGVQYIGTSTIGTKIVYKFDYSVGETNYQSLQTDQAKNWMFRINLGSTYYYFRVYANDDQYIYCEDIFDKISNLTETNYYMALIDFIFTRQKLTDITGTQNNPTMLWKEGGDWFNTKMARLDESHNIINTLNQNWTKASIKLIESKEYDEDGI
jgi:hypothetical protein